jgi:hypothetical protein
VELVLPPEFLVAFAQLFAEPGIQPLRAEELVLCRTCLPAWRAKGEGP